MIETFDLAEWRQKKQYSAAGVILLMVAIVYWFVYERGEIKYVFSHTMYVPIVLSAIFFGARGGILIGILGGLVLGPLMPINTITGEMQNTVHWVYRTAFFSLIGFIVGFASDKTVFYIKKIKWLAHHDKPTGLPNSLLMEKIIRTLPDIPEDSDESHYLIGLGIANAVEIRMNFGLNAIDQILSALADIIRNELPDNLLICRINYNSLGIIQPKINKADMKRLTQNLEKVLKKPFAFDDLHLHCDIYFGCVVLKRVIDEPRTYIEKISNAVSEAIQKKQHKIIFIGRENNDWVKENIQLLGELKHAIEAGELTMHYQPKVITQTGHICGAEALMRWHHPTLGNIPPDRFIPRTENSTLVDQLTYFAIDQALSQQVEWKKNGIAGMCVSVNISVNNFKYHDFTDTVLQLLDRHGVNGKYLELEITETLLMEEIELNIEKLFTLSDAGIILSIDDFGTGYSSLQYLAKLPISFIKIDQAFILNLPADTKSKHIVQTTINMAHDLGKEVVAEGVETKAAYDYLKNIDCDIIQGYYASPPVTAGEFENLYKQCNGQLLNGERSTSQLIQ